MTEVVGADPNVAFSIRIPESVVAHAGQRVARLAEVQGALAQLDLGVDVDDIRIRFYGESPDELVATMPPVDDREYVDGILDESIGDIMRASLGGRDPALDASIKRNERLLGNAQLGIVRGLVAAGQQGVRDARALGDRAVEIVDYALEIRRPSFIWRPRFPIAGIARLYDTPFDVPSLAAGAELSGLTLEEALKMPMGDLALRRQSLFKRGDPGSERAFANQPAYVWRVHGPDMKKAIKTRTRALEFATSFLIAHSQI